MIFSLLGYTLFFYVFLTFVQIVHYYIMRWYVAFKNKQKGK